MSALGDLIAVNNLGRNIQFAKLANDSLTSLARFDCTLFPESDEPSQFDLDYHCVLNLGCCKILAVNHYGVARIFARQSIHDAFGGRVNVLRTFRWYGDVEILNAAGNVLFGTSPLGYSSIDSAQTGLLIGDLSRALDDNDTGLAPPVVPARSSNRSIQEVLSSLPGIPTRVMLSDWGYLTALATSAKGNRETVERFKIAVASSQRIGMFAFDRTQMSLEKIWETTVSFYVDSLQFSQNENGIVAAGYSLESAANSEQAWDQLGAGGYSSLATADGTTRNTFAFDVDLAWGNGGVATTLSRDEDYLYGVDKLGGLHRFDLSTGEHGETSSPFASAPVGIAHLIRFNNAIICGFNRDGYRIHKYDLAESDG